MRKEGPRTGFSRLAKIIQLTVTRGLTLSTPSRNAPTKFTALKRTLGKQARITFLFHKTEPLWIRYFFYYIITTWGYTSC